ncbi:hypothetical protein MSG28_015133 [Choristoneura fumiferana]|uniref:Uncharacterized protein n=1 Tax=Choristoneura fumiferana TaxID=7141 RepID=A0ACC0KYI1_CHOFU|nr:hypothetical protein MSG28_015133 [Choristoneura fumiferana]
MNHFEKCRCVVLSKFRLLTTPKDLQVNTRKKSSGWLVEGIRLRICQLTSQWRVGGAPSRVPHFSAPNLVCSSLTTQVYRQELFLRALICTTAICERVDSEASTQQVRRERAMNSLRARGKIRDCVAQHYASAQDYQATPRTLACGGNEGRAERCRRSRRAPPTPRAASCQDLVRAERTLLSLPARNYQLSYSLAII